MKHISINISAEIKHILPDTLEKDLMDNEELCPMCHGLGVVVDNHIYGIQGAHLRLLRNTCSHIITRQSSFVPTVTMA